MDHDRPPTAGEIVRALGGATALSRNSALSARRSAIANWPVEGIPAKHWPALARIASETPDASWITLDALERHQRGVPALTPVGCKAA